MAYQTHPRLFLSFIGTVLLASTLSCGGSNTRKFMRFGNDVLASGSPAQMADSVSGDAILAGGVVIFSGVTGGDYLGAGGKQLIGGRIHGSLRAVGGDIQVTAAVDRNATITGGKIVLDSTAAIGQNAYFFGGDVQIKGAVREGVLASGGSVTLDGVVGRDVEISGGELHVGPNARIAGNLRYRVAPKKVHIDPAARITGTISALPVSSGFGRWEVFWMLGFLLVGAVVVTLLPRFLAGAAEIIPQRPIRAAIVGLCFAILVPLAIILLAITRIGIPLAVLATAAYVVVAFLWSVPFSVWLGRRILGARGPTGSQRLLVAFLVGGVILQLVGIIPIIGFVVMMITGIIGFGTIVLQAWRSRREGATLASV